MGEPCTERLLLPTGRWEITTKDAKLSFEPAEVATIRNDDEQKAYDTIAKA